MARLATNAPLMDLMGQTSSQPALETSEQLESGDETKLEKSKQRKHKRMSAESEPQSKEEESARALLELKNGIGPDSRTDLHDEDLAASAQLAAESSPHRPSHTVIDEASTHARKKSKRKEKGDGSKMKHGGNGDLMMLPSGEDLYNSVEAQLQEQPEEVFNLNYFSSVEPPQSELHQYTLGVDEIDSNDEEVAALLREYQTQTKPESPIVQQHDTDGTKNGFQQVAVDTDGNGDEPSMASSYQLPSLVYSSPIVGEKDKRNRRKHRGSTKQNDPEKVLACGKEDQFLIDPALTDLVVNSTQQADDPSLQQTGHQGKLQRPSRKRKREVNQPSIEASANGTLFNLPLSQTRQDQASPGTEDHQSEESQDAGQNQAPASKRKRRLPSFELPSIERQPTPPPKKARYKSLGNKIQRGGQKGKVYDPSMTEIAEKGGMFTEMEAAKLKRFQETYCEDNDLTERQFNERIQSTARNDRTLKPFWTEVCDVLPYRTNHSIQRYCRRQFHNYAARGTWSKEEDEMLGRAVAEKGRSWKVVGEMIERMPEDCRDRYRNYHTGGARHQKQGEWTEREVSHLCKAVNECMQAMAVERRRAKELKYEGRDMPESDTDEEIRETELINWGIVSETLQGTRSRLQCSYKWKRLKNDDRIQYLKHEGRIRREIKRIDSGKGPARNWRLGLSRRKAANMLPGDTYDFLQALADCGAFEERNIPWKSLGSKAFRAVWSTSDRKAAWTVLKDEIAGSENMNYQDIVNRLLTRLMAEQSDRLGEHWAGEGPKRRSKIGTKTSKAERAKDVQTPGMDGAGEDGHGVRGEGDSGVPEQDDSLFGDDIGDGTANELSTDGDADEPSTREAGNMLADEDDLGSDEDLGDGEALADEEIDHGVVGDSADGDAAVEDSVDGHAAVEDSVDGHVSAELATQVELLRNA
ncbi:MAG: hypothetical protein FRX48_04713 [Lasallia pustulata]|uniref:DNA-binding protein REB1 n=1 Tax=Lasallia pustulata TaxID=136370 RepID=A0A5M8PRW4_9LECA|nr:MAG: hypothetical protein FRX48_04713 [Lasallia pustulata]